MCASSRMGVVDANLDELCPPLKKAPPAKSMRTIVVRRHYRQNHVRVRLGKLLAEIATKGRVPSLSTIERLGAEKQQIVDAWLRYREAHEPTGNKARKMRTMIAGWL